MSKTKDGEFAAYLADSQRNAVEFNEVKQGYLNYLEFEEDASTQALLDKFAAQRRQQVPRSPSNSDVIHDENVVKNFTK